MVAETSPDQIRLNCTGEELHRLESFIETEFVPGQYAYEDYDLGEYRLWPYVLPEDAVPVEHERVPHGELAVRRGSRVHATDGEIGRVDEFLIDRRTAHITHLVLREGHLWGQKDVTLPIDEVERIEEDTVYLKISKRDIEALPSVPIHRFWIKKRSE